MALNNVTFNNVAGGLGRLPLGKDHVSAIIMDITSPVAWTNSLGKRYLSLEEAEQDLILDNPTYGLLHYMIKEFFRMAGPSELYVINSDDADYDAEHILELTKNDLRQAYVYSETAFAGLAAKVAEIEALAEAMEAEFSPCQFIMSVKDEATAVSTSLLDLKTLDAEHVSVLIGGDGSGEGKALATSLGVKYIPAGGTVLGALSAAAVHENIGWVAKFPLATITEFQEALLCDGTSVRVAATTVLSDLNTKGYIFPRTLVGINGTFFNDTHTTAAATSDLYSIENNRTLQKAKRELRTSLLPDLNSPLTVAPDGTLSPDTIKYFENKANRPMDLMQNAGELSNYKVTIDPDQDVLTTSILTLQVKIQPRGVARNIVVNIGFSVSVA